MCQPVSLSRNKPCAPCEKNKTFNSATAKIMVQNPGSTAETSESTWRFTARMTCGYPLMEGCLAAAQGKASRYALVKAIESRHNATNRCDHPQRDRSNDECIFDEVLAFFIFPEIDPKVFHLCFFLYFYFDWAASA